MFEDKIIQNLGRETEVDRGTKANPLIKFVTISNLDIKPYIL
jgi:hypothetical protein